jgi:hypothetical protein
VTTPYTIMRVVFTLPDGSQAMSPTVQIPADMRDLGSAKFRLEMWPDKPPAVSIAPEGFEITEDMWDE